jgi:4,5-DOPA dioxygenase extradiol
MKMPTLFLSHESPMLWDTKSEARDFLTQITKNTAFSIQSPKAILLVSAHWNTPQVTVSSAVNPSVIYDFGGFPEHYYSIKYPAPGSPELAQRIRELGKEAGISVALDSTRVLDHAAWIPLGLAFPLATVPIVTMSVQPRLSTAHHFALGTMLAPLRDHGVLIIGSGTATHNIGAFFSGTPPEVDAPSETYAREFISWLRTHINQPEQILNYRKEAPNAAKAHPTAEHFLPLIVAMGAGRPDEATCIHETYNYGHFAMASFLWC